MNLVGLELEEEFQQVSLCISLVDRLWTLHPPTQLEGGLGGSMENKRSGVARWRQEL
jgi:hypothetical protein